MFQLRMLLVAISSLACAINVCKGSSEVADAHVSKMDTFPVWLPEMKRGLSSDDAMRLILYYLSKMSKDRSSRPSYDRGMKRIGSEFLGKRAFAVRQPVHGASKMVRSMGSEFLGKRFLGSEFLGKRTSIDSELIGKRMGSEFLGKRTPSSELLWKRPRWSAAINSEDLIEDNVPADADDRFKRSLDSDLPATS